MKEPKKNPQNRPCAYPSQFPCALAAPKLCVGIVVARSRNLILHLVVLIVITSADVVVVLIVVLVHAIILQTLGGGLEVNGLAACTAATRDDVIRRDGFQGVIVFIVIWQSRCAVSMGFELGRTRPVSN